MLDPAATIIRKFGGPTKVSGITGVHRTRVSNWQRGKDVGGTGGTIPGKHIPTLLEYARDNEIEISAEEFYPLDAHPSDGAAA